VPKSPGTESQPPPTGLSRFSRSAGLRSPDMRQAVSVTATSCLRHRVIHLTPQPDGAPLCPVAYPSQTSFLVTATTGGGASPPIESKCMALEDPCQGLYRFSVQKRQVLLTTYFFRGPWPQSSGPCSPMAMPLKLTCIPSHQFIRLWYSSGRSLALFAIRQRYVLIARPHPGVFRWSFPGR
jgi:hypothetical protein